MESAVIEELVTSDADYLSTIFKDQVIARGIVSELAASVRNLLRRSNVSESCPSPVVTKFCNDDDTSRLCWAVEALFLHGLKAGLMTQLSRLFSRSAGSSTGSKRGSIPLLGETPTPCFWDVLLAVSHRDLVEEVSSMTRIKSDVGRCQAWIRLALNQSTLRSYLDAISGDQRLLKFHYMPHALLRDADAPDIISRYLCAIDGLRFEIGANSPIMNEWNATPLVLSGWIEPPPTPLAPGIDVAAEPDLESSPQPPLASSSPRQSSYVEGGARPKAKSAMRRVRASPVIPLSTSPPSSELNRSRIDSILEQRFAARLAEAEITRSPSSVLSDEPSSSPGKSSMQAVEKQKPPPHPGQPLRQSSAKRVDETYDDLVQDYSRSVGLRSIMGTPEVADVLMNGKGKKSTGPESIGSTTGSFVIPGRREGGSGPGSLSFSPRADVLSNFALSKSASSAGDSSEEADDDEPRVPSPPDPKALARGIEGIIGSPRRLDDNEEGWEVVKDDDLGELGPSPKYYMRRMGVICPEAGLDVENYQCKACRRPVGMIYGKARLCSMDGCYYCYECHEETTAGIPARMIHNWDFAQYPVSKAAHDFLAEVHSRPLLDLKVLNPLLYVAFPNMDSIRGLRTQLNFIRMYLFSCCDPNVAQDFRQKLWPRDHLYEHVHLYSVFDLTQVYYGQLASILRRAVAFGEDHVRQCQLCRTKGFVCEICRNPEVVFPFEGEKVYRCDQCRAVYHALCMKTRGPCPKCFRMELRREILQ